MHIGVVMTAERNLVHEPLHISQRGSTVGVEGISHVDVVHFGLIFKKRRKHIALSHMVALAPAAVAIAHLSATPTICIETEIRSTVEGRPVTLIVSCLWWACDIHLIHHL